MENSIIDYFSESIQTLIEGKPSIETLLNQIQLFFTAIHHIESYVPSLSLRRIVHFEFSFYVDWRMPKVLDQFHNSRLYCFVFGGYSNYIM